MVMSVASPWRSIREAVLQSVLAYDQQQGGERKHKRSLTWAGPAKAGGINDDDEPGFWEEEGTMELVQLGAERTKNVLILMSDTGERRQNHTTTLPFLDNYISGPRKRARSPGTSAARPQKKNFLLRQTPGATEDDGVAGGGTDGFAVAGARSGAPPPPLILLLDRVQIDPHPSLQTPQTEEKSKEG